MSGITLWEVVDTTIPTPPAGKITIFADSTDGPAFKDDAGTVTPFQGVPGEGVPAGGTAGQVLAKIDGTDYNTQWTTPAGGGDVVGPASATNNVVAVYDGTTGKLLKDGASYAGQTSITTLGTVATGTWNATAISAVYGGTGQTGYAVGDLLYASTTTALSKLAAGTNGHVLTLAAGVPTWAAAGGGSGDVVGPASATADAVALYDGTTGKLLKDGVTIATIRSIPQNSKSADYTLVLADAGGHIYHPSADTTARVWTIPANSSVAYPIGTALTFVNDTSGGVITIAITTDTLVLAGAGTTGSRTLAANGIATAIKMTSTRWQINGTGLT